MDQNAMQLEGDFLTKNETRADLEVAQVRKNENESNLPFDK